jgi:hypothetical protein
MYDSDREKRQERLAKLAGGRAIIRVGDAAGSVPILSGVSECRLRTSSSHRVVIERHATATWTSRPFTSASRCA